jgi:NTE family protein
MYLDAVQYFAQRNENFYDSVATWDTFNTFVKCVLASTNQPVLMPPVAINGQLYVDGGVREIAPIGFAKQLSATRIYAVINSPKRSKNAMFLPRLDRIGIRALDLMTTEILNNDAIVQEGVDLIVIRPDESLTDNDLEFIPAEMQNMRMIGQRKAKEILDF